MENNDSIYYLVDETGEEVALELILSFEHKGGVFCAFCDPDVDPEKQDVEVRILRVTATDDGDVYDDIESEEELDELFSVFMDIMEQDGE